MKILSLSIQNYVGARSVDLPVSTPVVMLAGRNGYGKSSLLEAVRHAIGGDPARVSLKKDYGTLLTNGAAQGFAEITTDAGAFSIVLPSGKGNHGDSPSLQFALGSSRFARLTADERRSFLFGLMRVSTSGAAVLEKLKARGCDPVKAEAIAADLRAGFPAAEKAAQGHARDAKSEWKGATGGETWGKDKAAAWKAPRPAETYDRDQVRAAEDLVNETDAEIAATNQKIGELRAAGKQRADAEARVADLRQKAARLSSLHEKLACDEAEHAEWTAKLAALPHKGGAHQKPLGCPSCGVALMTGVGGELVQYELPKHGALDPEVETKRGQQQDAVDLYARSIANDRRDIAAAEAAASELVEIDKTLASLPTISPAAAEAKLTELKADRKARGDTLQAMCAANKAAHDADTLTKKAAGHHADVLAWLAIADALAPDGIPAELLGAALGPINDRLRYHAELAQWPEVMIDSDMSIVTAYTPSGTAWRPYPLLSESEKWRADAMIAAAIAELSGVRLLLLDRFDMLDAQGREDLIYWLDGMAAEGVVDSAIVAGTLKSLPTGLPDSIQPVWIENGVAGKIREAA